MLSRRHRLLSNVARGHPTRSYNTFTERISQSEVMNCDTNAVISSLELFNTTHGVPYSVSIFLFASSMRLLHPLLK